MDKQARRAKAKAELGGLKDVREGKVSRLDQFELEDEEDVYEVVDEDKYAEIVENRRTAGDFVVDDGGLGYYDNGEEVLGVGEDGLSSKRRLAIDGDADDRLSRKARKLAEESAPQRNSILRHLKAGGPGASFKPMAKDRAPQNLLDIDALMSGNQQPANRPAKIAPMPALTGQMFNRTGMLGRTGMLPKFSLAGAQSHAQVHSNDMSMDVDDGHHESVFDHGDAHMDENAPADQPTDAAVAVKSEPGEPQPAAEAQQDIKVSFATKTTKKLKTFAPPPSSVAVKQEAKPLSDISVKTEVIFGDQDAPQAVSAESVSGKIDAQHWISSRTGEDGTTENFVRMYWLDAVENNGLLYIFGRVPVNEPGQATRYVSGCIVVHGCERNLFVLPKVIPDRYDDNGQPLRYDMGKVNSEINSLLVPSIIPRQEGRTHKAKPVQRKYAFEHGTTPREQTTYLKVKYSAKYPAPSAKQCADGQYFERIFGGTSSALELFILKRKLMGPCWIDIRMPRVTDEMISWCKLEAHVDNPKWVVRVESPPAAPPLVSMSISIKTAVNPVSHLHEIIAMSGVIHPKVDSDADSEVNPAILRRFTFIRQLGLSCGNAYPTTFPHDIGNEVFKAKDIALQTFPNERALLSMFLARIQMEDPDIISSHNLLGFELDVILSRAVTNKLSNWSILGKLRKSKPPRSCNDRDALPGRIFCDTYKAAKEFLRETTYSLTHLAQSQLKLGRQEIDPIDVPRYFSGAADIGQVARHTFWDAWLVQGLMFKLQVVPLTKQLTNLSGNLWSRTIRGARAERIEYLLLHEFHSLKYILPERKMSEMASNNKKGQAKAALQEDEADEDVKVGGMSRKRAKAAYTGGLVLEPKKGLYDSYILLLDFNSLYPSIIQEYNLCFTTVDWTKYMHDQQQQQQQNQHGDNSKKARGGNDDDEDDGEGSDDDVNGGNGEGAGNRALPPLPESTSDAGVLPRVIKTLVDRRRQVKNLLKNERDPAQRQQLDIRQKALKLTANSMYGCLGFSFSRFYARPIAALVTAMGREALQRTVDLATSQLQLDVIYGDTDSVMINTGLRQANELGQVKELGMKVKKEVNKLYKSLELDLDGIFRSMLLLKKKKYAALVVNEHADGTVTYEKEMKGLDLVRRDWCVMSKETGKFVVDQILSGESCEDIVMTIHNYLHELANKIRSGSMELEQYVITKGLNKNPKDYPDCSGQAHLQVALQMLKANKPVNIGDHIPYVICKEGPVGAPAAQRAYHPDEVRRAPTEYTIDYEWYLTNQILPPIARLCEPIEGTSPAILSERLGLDASRYARSSANADESSEDNWGFTPQCMMADNERFKGCRALTCVCAACHEEVEVLSVMQLEAGSTALSCGKCGAMFFGRKSAMECFCYVSNRITLLVRECQRRYYDCWLVCDDPTCGRRTMQQSVRGLACTNDCRGRMTQEYTDSSMHAQLKYLESLFDVSRMQVKREMDDTSTALILPNHSKHREVVNLLYKHMTNIIQTSAFNWVRPSLWTALFGGVSKNIAAGSASTSSASAAGMLSAAAVSRPMQVASSS